MTTDAHSGCNAAFVGFKMYFRSFFLAAFSILVMAVATLALAHRFSPGGYADNIYRYLVFGQPIDDHSTVIAFGDSQISLFPFRLFYPFTNVINHGVVADTTAQMLLRASHLSSRKRATAVLLAGVNDIRFSVPAAETHANYSKLLETAADHADRVYAISLLPTQLTPLREKIEALNTFISERCSRLENCQFVDAYHAIGGPFGYLADADTRDGLHLSYKGYWQLKSMLAL